MKLSENFSLQELTESTTAERLHISNGPTKEHIDNLKDLCTYILQPLRNKVGSIKVSSGYRSEILNKAIGGSKTSEHCKGLAADIKAKNNKLLYDTIIELNLPFNQLIWEFGNDNQPSWVHVSYSATPKRQILKAKKVNNKTVYEEIK